jgi:hypothetical protein
MSVAKGRRQLSSLTGWQHLLADRRTGGKHHSSERSPLSAIVSNPETDRDAVPKTSISPAHFSN